MITMDTKHTIPARPARTHLNTAALVEYVEAAYSLPLSRPTIYRAQRAGKLNPRRIGGRLLFSIDEVRRWIEGDKPEAERVEG